MPEEVEPKVRVGNMVFGRVVEVETPAVPLTDSNPKKKKKKKWKCKHRPHQLRVKRGKDLCKDDWCIVCVCGKVLSDWTDEPYEASQKLLPYIKQLTDRIKELELLVEFPPGKAGLDNLVRGLLDAQKVLGSRLCMLESEEMARLMEQVNALRRSYSSGSFPVDPEAEAAVRKMTIKFLTSLREKSDRCVS